MASDYGTSLTVGGGAIFTALAAANGAPTGQPHVSPGMCTAVDVVVSTAVAASDYRVWYLYGNTWTLDTTIGTVTVAGGQTSRRVLTPSCASGIYIEILNMVAGSTATATVYGRRVR